MALESAQLGAMALGSTLEQAGADDCMSIDWTLNMRRKCSQFFADGQQRPARHSASSIASRDLLIRGQVSMQPSQRKQKPQDASRDEQISNKRQVADKPTRDERPAASLQGAELELAEAVNYEPPRSREEDRLSALSASSSLLSQLLNSSLNQLIELDNGSSGLSCSCCTASACVGSDHRQRQLDERDLRVSRAPSRPRARSTSDWSQFVTQSARPALTCVAVEGEPAAAQLQQQHDSLLDETNSRLSAGSLSSSLSTCPCNFKSCPICMLQIASKLTLVQQEHKQQQLAKSGCDSDGRPQAIAAHPRAASISASSSVSSCAVRVTSASEANSSDDSVCKPSQACMGAGWSRGHERAQQLVASKEHLEWLSSGAFYADIKSSLNCEPLLLPVVLGRLDKQPMEPIFELDPRELDDGRAFMVEATASLARVVSPAPGDSSCSSPGRARPAHEPIYDIPSMSPAVRESSLSPDQKYPGGGRRESSARIQTIAELAELSAPSKSSHIVHLKPAAKLGSGRRPLAHDSTSALSRLATHGSRRASSWSGSTYSSCCTRCCPRRRLFSGRFRLRAHLAGSSCTSSACTGSARSTCCSSCSAFGRRRSHCSSPGSLSQEYLRRHRWWQMSRRRLRRVRRLRKRARRRHSGSHGERMRHARLRRHQPVLACELCRRRAGARPSRSARYQVTGAPEPDLIGAEHASSPRAPSSSRLAADRPSLRPSSNRARLPVGANSASSRSKLASKPHSACKRMVINNLSGAQQVVLEGAREISTGRVASSASQSRDKLRPPDNYRRHADGLRSPTGRRSRLEPVSRERRPRHRHRHYTRACHLGHESSNKSSSLAWPSTNRRHRRKLRHKSAQRTCSRHRRAHVTQFRELRPSVRKQCAPLRARHSVGRMSPGAAWPATSGPVSVSRSRRARPAVRRSLAANRQSQPNDLALCQNDQQIMNKFLVKTLAPQVLPPTRTLASFRPTKAAQARLAACQFVPRCQCSHCCLVQKLIRRDTERKLAKKLRQPPNH